MKSTIQDKTKLVNSVFSEVYDKYDLMNDVMSLGIHRIWKDKFIDWMNPSRNSSLIDVASGTGDIAKLFSLRNKNFSTVTCVEPNDGMLQKGKSNLIKFKNIKWIKSKAEILPIADNMYDFYSISYGIRNVSDINAVLKEAFRVLKPGGRFMCLEFSKIDNELLNYLYKQYSKTIPLIGKLIVGSDKPYKYLIESIENFYSQEELANLMKDTELEFYLAGDLDKGNPDSLSDADLNKIKNNNYINYLGHIDINKELFKYDINIIMSMYEGSSRILLESLYIGLICISNNIPGTTALSSKFSNSFFVNDNNIQEFKRNLNEIINNDTFLDSTQNEFFGNGADYNRKLINENYTSVKIAAAYNKIYQYLRGEIESYKSEFI